MTTASMDSGKFCIVLLLASTTLAKPYERNLDDSAQGRILHVQDLSGAPPNPHHVAIRSATTADESIRGLSDTLAALQKSGELSKMAASLPAGSLQVIRKLAVPLLDTMLAEQENPAEGAATMSLERNLHAIQERASSSLRQSFAFWNLFPRFHLVSHKNITFGPLFLKKDLEIGSPEETVITPPPKAPETIPTPTIVAPSPEQEVRVTTPPPVVVTPVPTVASSLVPGESPPKTAPGPPRKVCTKQVAHMQNPPQLATITATIANEHVASSPPRVVVSSAPPAIDAVPEGLAPTGTADSITKLTPIPIVPEFTPPAAVVISETSPPASESEDPATFSTAGVPANPISGLPEKPVVPESTSPTVVVTSGITPPATASPITPISVVAEFPSESSAVPGPKQPNKVCTSQRAVVQKSPTVTLIPTAEVVLPAMKPAIVAAPETSAPTVVAGPINGLTAIPVVPEPTPPPVVVISEEPPASAIPESPVHVESSRPSVIPPVSAPATISAIESEEHATFPTPGVLVPAVTPSIIAAAAATESSAKPAVPESTSPAVVVTAGNSPPASAIRVTPANVVPVLPSEALPVPAIEAPKRVCTSQRATVLNSPPGATVPAVTPAVIAAAETAAPPKSAFEAAPIPTVFESKEPPVVSIAETTPLASTIPSAPGGGVPVVQSVSLPVPASKPSKRVCTNQQAIVSNPPTVTPTLKIKSNEQATSPISEVVFPAVNPAIIAASETSAPPVTPATEPASIPTPQEAVIADISPLESTSVATPVSVVNGALNVSSPVSAPKTPKKVCTKQRTVAQNSPPVTTIPATESKEHNTVPPPQVAVIAVAPVVSATPVTSAPPVDTHPVTEPLSMSAALDSTTGPAAIIPEATPPVNELPLQPVSAVPVAAAQSLGKVCTNQVAVV